ncbi:MAG: AAA family ATPase [Nitrospira sp.]|nr:AAA family ATPase [Nitrospira sp.]
MKIREVVIHNFRSFKDATIYMADYCLLIGANNSGKSSVLDAVRAFYEKDLKFDFQRDFPKFATEDKESWIEIEYELTTEEAETIRTEYRQAGDRFRVRRVLYSAEKGSLHLYAYEGGILSTNQFYGEDSVGKGKLGEIVYIPAVTRIEDVTKFSGTSPLRDLVNTIFKKLVKNSEAFTSLQDAITKFGKDIQTEETPDQHSLQGLEDDINAGLDEWQAKFKLKVNPLSETEVVKSLLDYEIFDEILNANQSASSYGHGFQRQLIYRLLRISANYSIRKAPPKKKEFSPDFALLLFEEPEAFLHPPQQSQLDRDLRKLSDEVGRQVIISSHSPQFVSHATDHIPGIVRLQRYDGQSVIGQIRPDFLAKFFTENQEINNLASGLKNYQAGVDEEKLEMESVKYFLWLNPDRCGVFFSKRALIVEGPSEVVLINYLIQTGKIRLPTGGLFVIDALGKCNIHRFMNLLSALKIEHSVLHDQDPNKTGDDKTFHERINKLVQTSRNSFTRKIHVFDEDLETFLGVTIPDREYRKPSRLLLALKESGIDEYRIEALCKLVEDLAGISASTHLAAS